MLYAGMRWPSVLGSSLSSTWLDTAVHAADSRVSGTTSQETPAFSLWRGTSGTVLPATGMLVPIANGEPARVPSRKCASA